ncbi:MAG: tRNA preQ1(34) S-adenosylmethionine ribosyltransferase-isomerase QueA [Bryobacteraceae bacterium]|nr:tRNA preQ1(34) S-adenosylmethionine ribosyltransferase-isomerase QueA [Bryobacteraceae bacterium]
MKLIDFDFQLPEDRIAQQPLEDRAASRMLVVHRRSGEWRDHVFRQLPDFLTAGDCLVTNNSKVIPARLFGHRAGHTGLVEVLLERAITPDQLTWRVLARPGRKLPTGERITFSDRLQAEICARGEFGERTLRFQPRGDFFEALELAGHVPLPPYIHREDTAADRGRYQTVFASERGSVAAPTAGLHFTPEVLDACRAAGAEVANLTLHVGLGTFQPIRSENLEEVTLHSERYFIPRESAERIRAAQRVIAIGTTSVRTIETAAADDWRHLDGETDIFIQPGFRFRRVDAMLTNFHLPQSSLLVLVCAFGGRELILDAYRHAVASGYRFYSYGDCMLIL